MANILVVYGTRPEALKLAPVVKEVRALGLNCIVWYTGQSPDLKPYAILPPDAFYDWSLKDGALVGGKTSTGILQTILVGLVVVQGDTRTAFQAAVAAYEAGIPVFHIEAGVRTGDLANPWPEEGYRQMISRIATYHACATEHNAVNLLNELPSLQRFWKTPEDALTYKTKASRLARYSRVTGNPIVESVRERAERHGELGGPHEQPRVLITLHRKESAQHFQAIWSGIANGLAGANAFVEWVTHPNGLAQVLVPAYIHRRSPMPPDLFTGHLANADLVITDSGGVQEECNVLGVPCVIARDVTDRQESLGEGGAILGGRTPETLVPAIQQALAMDRSAIRRDCFGDGTASVQIAHWLREIVTPS